MNADEISNMPAGNRLDFAIATLVMGMDFQAVPREGGGEYSTWWDANFNPSIDIVAAWKVMEKMQTPRTIISIRSEGNLWFVRIFRDPMVFEAGADKAPLAICRAALLAIMEPQIG